MKRETNSSEASCHNAPSGAPVDPLLINAKQAARLLSISERKLWQMSAEFEIPCTRIGTRNLYSPEALRAWIAKNSRGGEQ